MKTKMLITIFAFVFCFQQNTKAQSLRSKIDKKITEITEQFGSMSKDRTALLDQVAFSIYKDFKENQTLDVVFIDNDNNSKSQLAMIWFQTGLLYFRLNNIDAYSAGVNFQDKPIIGLEDLKNYGFTVRNANTEHLYSYTIKYSSNSWLVYPKSISDLKLTEDNTHKIYVDKVQLSTETEPKVELPFNDTSSIPLDMVYIVARLNNIFKIQSQNQKQ